jgi:hypothetical protein
VKKPRHNGQYQTDLKTMPVHGANQDASAIVHELLTSFQMKNKIAVAWCVLPVRPGQRFSSPERV